MDFVAVAIVSTIVLGHPFNKRVATLYNMCALYWGLCSALGVSSVHYGDIISASGVLGVLGGYYQCI